MRAQQFVRQPQMAAVQIQLPGGLGQDQPPIVLGVERAMVESTTATTSPVR
jgi:hypothetical protein